MVANRKHIDESQRGTISRMLSHGNRLKEIAKALGMHPTALSREIRRNRSKTKPGDGECPIDAQCLTLTHKLQNSIDFNKPIVSFGASDVAFLVTEPRLSPPSYAYFNVQLKPAMWGSLPFSAKQALRNPWFSGGGQPTTRGLSGE